MRTIYTAAQIAAAFVTLGVQPHNTQAERKAAFLALAKSAHPDAGGSTEAFQALEQAYAICKRQPVTAKPQAAPEQPSKPSSNANDGASSKPGNTTGNASSKPGDKPSDEPAQAAPSDTLAKRRAERQAAAVAVADYYNGSSLPFKSASDRFADLRLDKAAKAPSKRQAALLAAMLAADTADNIKPSGTFVRGGFKLPASLIKPDATGTFDAQPETGCVSDMLGRVISYVSGPTSGTGQRDTILRVDLAKAADEISAQLGGAIAKAALARIAELQAAHAARGA